MNQLTVWERSVLIGQVSSYAHPRRRKRGKPYPASSEKSRDIGQNKEGSEEKSGMDSRYNKTVISCVPSTTCVGECVLNNLQRYRTNIVLPIITNRYPSVYGNDFHSLGI